MNNKKLYTSEELSEIIEWFEERLDKLPKSQQIDTATFVPNVVDFFNKMKDIIEEYSEKPAFTGNIEILFNLRKALLTEHEELK